MSLVARDITEQQLAQANLAEMERRLSEAEAYAHTGRWMWDVATGAVQWSDELHRIFGIDPMDFEGTIEAHLARVHPDDLAALKAAMDQSLVTARPFDTELRVVRATARCAGCTPVLRYGGLDRVGDRDARGLVAMSPTSCGSTSASSPGLQIGDAATKSSSTTGGGPEAGAIIEQVGHLAKGVARVPADREEDVAKLLGLTHGPQRLRHVGVVAVEHPRPMT